MIEHRAMKERQRIKEEQEKKENMTATKVNNKLMSIDVHVMLCMYMY